MRRLGQTLWVAVGAGIVLEVVLMVTIPVYRELHERVGLPFMGDHILAMMVLAYLIYLGLAKVWKVKPSFPEVAT